MSVTILCKVYAPFSIPINHVKFRYKIWHHYIIDVILGSFCAIIAIFVFDFVLMKTKMRVFIEKYADFIA